MHVGNYGDDGYYNDDYLSDAVYDWSDTSIPLNEAGQLALDAAGLAESARAAALAAQDVAEQGGRPADIAYAAQAAQYAAEMTALENEFAAATTKIFPMNISIPGGLIQAGADIWKAANGTRYKINTFPNGTIMATPVSSAKWPMFAAIAAAAFLLVDTKRRK